MVAVIQLPVRVCRFISPVALSQRHTHLLIFMLRYEDTIVFSFIGETRVLHLNDSELEEIEQYSGFDMAHSTIACGNVVGNLLVQVTEVSVRLSECSPSGNLIDEWKVSDRCSGSTITVACLNASQCALSYGHGSLVLLEVQNGKLIQMG